MENILKTYEFISSTNSSAFINEYFINILGYAANYQIIRLILRI